ncbi:hypothetical protein HDU97_002347 [Phlyctochytrium planicorne]|nr:hypothetical protein HDU97_002347 [Phlyctochytrium planicorne]
MRLVRPKDPVQLPFASFITSKKALGLAALAGVMTGIIVWTPIFEAKWGPLDQAGQDKASSGSTSSSTK